MKECFDFSSVYDITDKMVESRLFSANQIECVEIALKTEKIYTQLLYDMVRAHVGEGDKTRPCFDVVRGVEQRKQLDDSHASLGS